MLDERMVKSFPRMNAEIPNNDADTYYRKPRAVTWKDSRSETGFAPRLIKVSRQSVYKRGGTFRDKRWKRRSPFVRVHFEPISSQEGQRKRESKGARTQSRVELALVVRGISRESIRPESD